MCIELGISRSSHCGKTCSRARFPLDREHIQQNGVGSRTRLDVPRPPRSTLTGAVSGLATFVEDRASGRFKDFVVTPVRRTSLMLGYLASTFAIAFALTLIVLVAGQLFMLTQGETTMNVAEFATAIGYAALSCLAFSALASFVVTFIRSNGAYSAFATIIGTAVGFLAGAYITPGIMPEGVQRVLAALPFMHAAQLIREPYTAGALEAVTGGQPQAIEALSEMYGLTSSVGDLTITSGIAIGSLAILAIVFTILGGWRLTRTIR